MAYASSYSHYTEASIPAESWDEAWFSIMSWKGYLQSFPGLLSFTLSARPLDNGDVRFLGGTHWEYPEQLDEWRQSHWSMKNLLTSIKNPAYDVVEATWEDFE